MTGLRSNQPANSLTTVFVVSLALLIVLPVVPLTLATWFQYRADVAKVEEVLAATNRQIAILARQNLETLLRRLVLVASEPDLDDVESQTLSVRFWEGVDAAGTVVTSTLTPDRIGRPLGRDDAGWRVVYAHSDHPAYVSQRIESPELGAPLVMVRVPLKSAAGGVSCRVAYLDTAFLHRWMTSRFDSFVDRHVYVLDARGRPIIYTDMTVIPSPERLAVNPPVVAFTRGQSGPIRYRSTISDRERVGFIDPMDETGWGLVVSVDIGASLLDIRRRMLLPLAAVVVGGLLAIGVFAYFSRRVIAPVIAVTRDIQSRDERTREPLAASLPLGDIREFRELADGINRFIATAKKAEEEAIQAEKFATFGELTTGLAHEIGTPLNVMRGNAQLRLRRMDKGDPNRPVLETIVAQTGRIADMVRLLLDLARADSVLPVPLDVRRAVERAAEAARGMDSNADIRLSIAADLPDARGFPLRMEHAILNLLINACHVTQGRGAIDVTVRHEIGSDGECIRIEVADEGCGIPEGDLPHIFRPFFSTKGSGRGTGLGLTFVDHVVREHEGTIEVVSVPGNGTVFTVRLPVPTPIDFEEDETRG